MTINLLYLQIQKNALFQLAAITLNYIMELNTLTNNFVKKRKEKLSSLNQPTKKPKKQIKTKFEVYDHKGHLNVKIH